MANNEIVEFIAKICSIDNLQSSYNSACMDAFSFNKEMKRKSELHLFLISKLKGFEF